MTLSRTLHVDELFFRGTPDTKFNRLECAFQIGCCSEGNVTKSLRLKVAHPSCMATKYVQNENARVQLPS